MGHRFWVPLQSLLRPPVLWGGQPGYRDPCVPGAVGAGVGTQHQFHSVRPCGQALLAVGVAEGCPRGGAFHRCEGRLRSGAPHPPVGAGGVRAWRPVTNPTARALASWLCALWGRHEGARGGRLLPGCGASGVGCPPTPDYPPSGRAAGAHYPLAVGAGGVRAWGPVTNPTARALARCGGGMRVPGGGASCLGMGRPGSGALPPPTACPLGGLPGPTTRRLWVRGGCGRGDPSSTPQRALLRAGFARCGGGTRAPGGGASCLGVERPRSGALPPPTARPLGGPLGPTTHWLWVRGSAGVGTRHQPHSARSCALWGRHEGARGGRLLPGYGASGVGRSPTPDCPPSGRAAGAHYPLAVGGGKCGRGDPSPTP